MPTGVSCDTQLIYAFAADVSFFPFDIFKKELHILYTYLYKIFVETDISWIENKVAEKLMTNCNDCCI